MVKFFQTAEIRKSFVNELVKIPARTKNGQKLDAMEFNKRYYNAEIEGEPCLLRVRDSVMVNTEFKRGDIVTVFFGTCEVEGDVSQVYVSDLQLQAYPKISDCVPLAAAAAPVSGKPTPAK